MAQPLAQEDEPEVLEFLAARPLHTVIMAGKVRDNGVVSALNRGTFYAYRNAAGVIEGVALIGHASLIEARSPQAVEAFAYRAQGCLDTQLIVIREDQFELFWSFYRQGGQPLRKLRNELLFELRWPTGIREAVPGLRPATLDDLELALLVQAGMTMEQCLVNPLQQDPEGFRQRVTRRIEQGRIYVCVEDGRLLFKTDILADTPEMIYLEGVWVHPHERGRGYGLRCISQLGRELLTRAPGVCVFTDKTNHAAIKFYRKAGYRLRAHYRLAFVGEV
jgi:ribosomal protein S18 acetylase RimI-like enzyme